MSAPVKSVIYTENFVLKELMEPDNQVKTAPSKVLFEQFIIYIGQEKYVRIYAAKS